MHFTFVRSEEEIFMISKKKTRQTGAGVPCRRLIAACCKQLLEPFPARSQTSTHDIDTSIDEEIHIHRELSSRTFELRPVQRIQRYTKRLPRTHLFAEVETQTHAIVP
jgi:hypothetical protein